MWFPAIVNSPEETTEMVNFIEQSECRYTVLIGGSTNSTDDAGLHAISFADYIPNSSGKLKLKLKLKFFTGVETLVTAEGLFDHFHKTGVNSCCFLAMVIINYVNCVTYLQV